MSLHSAETTAPLPDEAYAIIAEFRAKPGMEDALHDITLPLVAQARSEPGTLLFYLLEDRQASGHFLFYEIYASRSDFETHAARPHVRAWFTRLSELTDGGANVVHLQVIGPR